MSLTIVFNGTSDTHYKDDKAFLEKYGLKQIEKGSHTLSFFVDCIDVESPQKLEPLFNLSQPDNLILQTHNELVVLEGPDDTGTGVHNIIVAGLMAVLNAMMRGEKEINFVGFSRGSVEAIHMTHELQRIKNYLIDSNHDHTPNALAAFIAKGCFNPSESHKWRTERIDKLYKHGLEEALKNKDHLQNLKEGLTTDDELKCYGMLLDPVPGFCEGSFVPYIPWVSAQHTSIASLVNELTVAYMDSEFSIAFRPLWVDPEAGAQTKVNRFHLPGCHSTAVGNPVNHDPLTTLKNSKSVFPYEQMRDVQKLFFYKLLQFGHQHGIKFKTSAHHQLNNRFLTDVFEHFINHKEVIGAQNEFLIQSYQNIAANLESYRRTRETAYLPSWLSNVGLGGIEHSSKTERWIHTSTRPQDLADCFSFDIKGAQIYVNYDHLTLDFIKHFFPESPTNLSMSEISSKVERRRDAPPTETDATLLCKKIDTLLMKCQRSDDSNFDHLILNLHAENNPILSKIIELVPPQLAGSVFSVNPGEMDKTPLHAIIAKILDFNIPPESEKNQELLSIINKYMNLFKSNILKSLVSQAHKLTDAAEQFQCQAIYDHDPSNHEASQESKMTENLPSVLDYMKVTQQHYDTLKDLQKQFELVQNYLPSETQQILKYKINDVLNQLPSRCESVLSQSCKSSLDNLNTPEIRKFDVLKPYFAKQDGAHLQQICNQKIVELTNIIDHHQQAQINLDSLVKIREATITELHIIQEQLQTEVNELKCECSNFSIIVQDAQKVENDLKSHIENHKAQIVELMADNAQLEINLDKLKDELEQKNKQHTELEHSLQNLKSVLADASGDDNPNAIFTWKVLIFLGLILGALCATISATCLVIGSGGVVVPILSMAAGATLFGASMFQLNASAKKEYQKELYNQFFVP